MKKIRKVQCAGCGCFFVGVASFNMHRRGSYTHGRRRCLSPAQMQACGMASEPVLVRLMQENKTYYEQHAAWYLATARLGSAQRLAVLQGAHKRSAVAAE